MSNDWRERGEELMIRYRAAGYDGVVPEVPTYSCSECSEHFTFPEDDLPEWNDPCPKCGERTLEGPILVMGFPIVLGESDGGHVYDFTEQDL